jgi:tRNA-specific adenosine deaminase 1
MAAQDDPTPWDVPSSTSSEATSISKPSLLHGRGYFSSLGVVRRKPSRPDAPPTLSKSCSDKIAHTQCTSILRSPAAMVLSPENFYLSSLTLPQNQYSQTGCNRAFSALGRMAPLTKPEFGQVLEGYGYRFQPFEMKITKYEFQFSRRQKADKLVPSNLAAAWSPHHEETIIGGALQGRKQFDPRGASKLSKKRSWGLALQIAAVSGMVVIQKALDVKTYGEVKQSWLMEGRKRVKKEVREEALSGWARSGGDGFGLDIDKEVREH